MTQDKTVVNYQPEMTVRAADLPLPQRVYAGIHPCHYIASFAPHYSKKSPLLQQQAQKY